jgi:rhodanese-related sulfurtransferase
MAPEDASQVRFAPENRARVRFRSEATHGRKLSLQEQAMQHSPRFLKIVDDARKRIREASVDDIKDKLDNGEKFLLVDVREEGEYAKDHLPGAIHLGKGVIERDIEARVPDLNSPVVLYCGGGFRSALAADNLQKMGYTNVLSMDGGVRGWREKGYPFTRD